MNVLGSNTAETRAPTVAMRCASSAVAVADRLKQHGIMTAASDFYAVRPLEALNIPLDPGVLRLSFVHYTSQNDVDVLIKALDAEL